MPETLPNDANGAVSDKELLSAKDYALAHPDVAWTEASRFQLYRHTSERFTVIAETADTLGFGLHRDDVLAEKHGISSSEKDAQDLANDFVGQFCHHLSLFDLEYLDKALQQEITRRRQEIERNRNGG